VGVMSLMKFGNGQVSLGLSGAAWQTEMPQVTSVRKRLWSLRQPEREDLSYLADRGDEFPQILLKMGKIIGVQPPGEQIDRKNFGQRRQFNDPFFSARFESAPVTDVLFRPEEVHGASAIGPVFGPFPKRHGRVPHQTFRFDIRDETILHLHSDWQSAIKTRGLDPHGFPFE